MPGQSNNSPFMLRDSKTSGNRKSNLTNYCLSSASDKPVTFYWPGKDLAVPYFKEQVFLVKGTKQEPHKYTDNQILKIWTCLFFKPASYSIFFPSYQFCSVRSCYCFSFTHKWFSRSCVTKSNQHQGKNRRYKILWVRQHIYFWQILLKLSISKF